MQKIKLSRRFMHVLLLMAAALALPESAAANYASDCAGCHGPVTAPTNYGINLKGKTAAQIQSAINNNKGGMGTAALKALTPAQVSAIAVELAPTTTTTRASTTTTRASTTTTTVRSTTTTTLRPPVVPTCLPPKVRNLDTNKCVAGPEGSLLSGVERTDVYAVTCAATTSYLSVSVMDLPPPLAPKISIVATKGGYSSGQSIDGRDGDDKYSPVKTLRKGSGVYTVSVKKSAARVACNDEDDDDCPARYVAGAERYRARVYCKNARGVQTSTKYRLTRDQ